MNNETATPMQPWFDQLFASTYGREVIVPTHLLDELKGTVYGIRAIANVLIADAEAKDYPGQRPISGNTTAGLRYAIARLGDFAETSFEAIEKVLGRNEKGPAADTDKA